MATAFARVLSIVWLAEGLLRRTGAVLLRWLGQVLSASDVLAVEDSYTLLSLGLLNFVALGSRVQVLLVLLVLSSVLVKLEDSVQGGRPCVCGTTL